MKIITFASDPSAGKSAVIKQLLSKGINEKVAYFKVDVQFTEDDKEFSKLGIPSRKMYSGEICPDHSLVLVFNDAVAWAKKEKAEILFIETAGLCFRCSPYMTNTLGICILGAASGINLPAKVGPMLTLADVVLITKTDLISQAEKEVFVERVRQKKNIKDIYPVDALRGLNLEGAVKAIKNFKPKGEKYRLRGIAPVGVCTLCVGNRETGWDKNYGILRKITGEIFYKGE